MIYNFMIGITIAFILFGLVSFLTFKRTTLSGKMNKEQLKLYKRILRSCNGSRTRVLVFTSIVVFLRFICHSIVSNLVLLGFYCLFGGSI